jgi:hypothetical protein
LQTAGKRAKPDEQREETDTAGEENQELAQIIKCGWFLAGQCHILRDTVQAFWIYCTIASHQ